LSLSVRIRTSHLVVAALAGCALAAAPAGAATPAPSGAAGTTAATSTAATAPAPGAAAPGAPAAPSGGAAAGGATGAAAPGGTTAAKPAGAAAPGAKPARSKAGKTARKRAPLSAHLGQRTLRRGARGHDVRVLQSYLTQAGFATPVVGTFGPLTESNVRAFERAQGLRADGIVSRADAIVLRKVVADVVTPPAAPGPPPPPPAFATLRADGTAAAPASAPAAVRAAIAAANQIASTPYLWGGGHARWDDKGYDCSGSVGFALHGAGLLDASEDSTGFESYGEPGPGRWITLYANADHVYAVIAGLRYDTSGASPSRWQAAMRTGAGFVVRHPAGL
jgi:peptidoglycan hydrolase-like protein with peptidoglycan-binding domain